jgi:protein-tyrosine phosphatase
MGFVEPLLEKGRKVLIHCQNGAGRSPLIVIAVLMRQGMKAHDALRLVKERHPKCGFTDNQTYFLNHEMLKFMKPRKVD